MSYTTIGLQVMQRSCVGIFYPCCWTGSAVSATYLRIMVNADSCTRLVSQAASKIRGERRKDDPRQPCPRNSVKTNTLACVPRLRKTHADGSPTPAGQGYSGIKMR